MHSMGGRIVAGILTFVLSMQGVPTAAFAQELVGSPEEAPTEVSDRRVNICVPDGPELAGQEAAGGSAQQQAGEPGSDGVVADAPADKADAASPSDVPSVSGQGAEVTIEVSSDEPAGEVLDQDGGAVAMEEGDPSPLSAQASTATVYDLNKLPPFAGRTKADVVQRYSAALNATSGYDSGDSGTWYAEKASKTAPYAPGRLTADTLGAMQDMTDFFRWLVGVQPLKASCAHSADLQAGALVRNFDFNHWVDDSKRPADMSSGLWEQGSNATHNIIAMGYTPSGCIGGWMNEGYDLASGTWDTLGHRYALIGESVSSVQFGYAGNVGIGKVAATDNAAAGFCAFPSPGPVPRNLVYAGESAWSLSLDRQKARVGDADAVSVRITNQGTGKVFLRSIADNTVSASDGSSSLAFAQPADMASDGAYDGTYRVEVSGLVDADGGSSVTVQYAVDFVDAASDVRSRVSRVSAEFSDLTIYQSLKSTADLKKIAAVLPNSVKVGNTLGATWELPVMGAWKLDTANKCYTNSVAASSVPANLIDKKGLLKTVRIPYTISSDYYDGYNSLSISPSAAKAGDTVSVSVYRTNISTDTSRVFKIVNNNGSYSGKLWLDSASSKWFDKKSSDASAYGASHRFEVKGITKADAGEYVSIYFNKAWGDTAYVSTSIEKLTVQDTASLAKATVTGLKNKTYSGKKITQKPVVRLGGKTLRAGTDYKVTYTNNKNVGTATVTVVGMGSYSGKQTLNFKITPKKASISKVSAAKRKVTVTWKKAGGAGGYEIQYSTNKKFKAAKTAKVTKAKVIKKQIKGLKSGKRYYVRIRSYKKVGKTVYRSGWSKAKSVKVK